jgi:arylsulfatase
VISSLTQAESPNFIFVITDDISAGDLSLYGNEFVQTPNLERLAQTGLVFDHAHNSTSSCSPSRCSIITGRYPHNTGAPELHMELPPDQVTFVEALRDAGYYTLLSGKNHMNKDIETLGFDVASDSKPAGSEKWVRHLRERPKDKPFFFWLASHDGHRPFQINKKAPVYQPSEVQVPPMMFDGPETRADLAGFCHEVSRSDYYVGELMKELKAQGIVDNTYIIYCSDNGRPFPRCKSYLYDSGIQTPLVISGPGVKQGRSDSMVSSIDYAATILSLAGVEKPASVQGVSFVPVLRDPKARVRDVIFSERNWHVFQLHERSVRMDDWLYIWNAWPNHHNVSVESAGFDVPAAKELWDAAAAGKLNDAQRLLTLPKQPAEMLFHVGNDPHQFHNLVDNPEHKPTLEQMQEQLDTWKTTTGDSVQDKPTPDRQPIHHVGKKPPVSRGEMPGELHQATQINHPGPVRSTVHSLD